MKRDPPPKGCPGVRKALGWLLTATAMCVIPAPPGGEVLADGAGGKIHVADFSSGPGDGAPDLWRPQTFSGKDRQTRYERVKGGDSGPALRAVSENAASALVRRLSLDPARWPWLSWRWKVTDPIRGENLRKKTGDDYAARIYVTFAADPENISVLEKVKRGVASAIYGKELPYRALNYLWSFREPADTMAPNPYTDRSVMIVATQGAGRLGEWVSVRRNIVEDYRRAFGEEPPPISGIAVMTDSDDTGESATAYYGDIWLSEEPLPEGP